MNYKFNKTKQSFSGITLAVDAVIFEDGFIRNAVDIPKDSYIQKHNQKTSKHNQMIPKSVDKMSSVERKQFFAELNIEWDDYCKKQSK